MNTTAQHNAAPVAHRQAEEVTCWKCLGSRFFTAYSHIANGRCFTCGGSGKCSIALWTQGVARDRTGNVFFSFGRGRGELLLINRLVDDGDTWGGICQQKRADALACIKTNLDAVKDGALEVIAMVALRLTALDDNRAIERAIAYVGGDAGQMLADAMPGARAAVTLAYRMAE